MIRTALRFFAVLTMLTLPVSAAEPIDPEILAVREAAWRAWFAGDVAALRPVLPGDFLAIGWRGREILNREQTLAASREFKEAGGRLVSLSFPETRAQRIGDTVIFYGSFDAVIAFGTREERVRGLLTEVFVHRDGRWLHPGWHLDSREMPD